MRKNYALRADQFVQLVEDGRGCLATDRITVDGRPVGYMYREQPNNPLDSGWRFFAGDEDQAYMAVNAHHDVYGLNTIANYDRAVIPLLDAPIGSAFIREGDGLIPDAEPRP